MAIRVCGDGRPWKCFGVSSEQHPDGLHVKDNSKQQTAVDGCKTMEATTGLLADSQNPLSIEILESTPFRASPDLMYL